MKDELQLMISEIPFTAKALLKETLMAFTETHGRALDSRSMATATATAEEVQNDEFVGWLANCIEDANSRATDPSELHATAAKDGRDTGQASAGGSLQ